MDNQIRNDSIKVKTDELINSVYLLSRNLPDNELLQLGDKLISCVGSVPENLESGYSVEKEATKVKFLIKVFQALAECKNYLKLVQSLNYGETNELVDDVENLSDLIVREFPTKVKLNKAFDI